MFEAFLRGYALGSILSFIRLRWVVRTFGVLFLYCILRYQAWSSLALVVIAFAFIMGARWIVRRILS